MIDIYQLFIDLNVLMYCFIFNYKSEHINLFAFVYLS
jgi:hypothetical protein